MKLEFHPDAEVEQAAAAQRYESEVAGLGAQFVDEVQAGSRRLLEFPAIRSPLADRIRRLVLERFPFSVVYIVEGEFVRILAVAHQSRRPGYWRSRVARSR